MNVVTGTPNVMGAWTAHNRWSILPHAVVTYIGKFASEYYNSDNTHYSGKGLTD